MLFLIEIKMYSFRLQAVYKSSFLCADFYCICCSKLNQKTLMSLIRAHTSQEETGKNCVFKGSQEKSEFIET